MDELSDWLQDVLQSIDDKQIDVRNVCDLIESNKLSIETVVTDLCPFLTNTEINQHSKGILILSKILSSLPKDFLSSKQIQHLTQFYCDRLKDLIDYSVVPHILTGLLSILSYNAINSEASEANQRAALDAISQILIERNEQILNPCLKSCASNCVNLSLNSPHLNVRRSALNCLALIADTFDDSELHHLRDQMVRDLRKALNDRKRLVRKCAVRARFKWILVGQPGKL